MAARDAIALSKLLSFVLRHDPGSIGIALEQGGWIDVERLLAALAQRGEQLSRAALEQLVRTSDKQRFAFSEDGTKIRASQGHSVEVDLGYAPAAPPELLFHGTVARFLTAIRAQGLARGKRQHVHLSPNRELAVVVGKRRGTPVVLEVDAGAMAREGHVFFCAANGVWLVEHVPARFIRAD